MDMTATSSLQSGDHLTRAEFLRIWDQLPNIKKAELIDGVVYMPSPVSKDHARMDARLSGWLGVYVAATSGCDCGSNATTFLLEDCPQPDDFLCILPEYGGKSWSDNYLHGSPELLAEVSHSSASIDLHQKFDLYQKAGVQEYLVILLKKQEIRWHRLVTGKYELIAPDADGILRSRVFPGLWLDGRALLDFDITKVLAKLNEGIATEEHKRFVVALAARKAGTAS